jgi:hypothetical protein
VASFTLNSSPNTAHSRASHREGWQPKLR